ncbi:hypothetical protein [uncultured Flavonifractor sp.]|uniref:hypothetical protein n=1 Tax=uncultured Flavonifractor sp. TaxID=1193534 RepID=UPI002635BE96|nr:hypothetical protein [uncultured Flavonifractor sp.]
MEHTEKMRTISIQVTPETKEKAAWLARQSCRSLSAYVRQLLRVQIRAYEAENGPVPK